MPLSNIDKYGIDGGVSIDDGLQTTVIPYAKINLSHFDQNKRCFQMKADEIELIGALAEALALEYADVDDEDLFSLREGVDLLTRAQQYIECCGRQCPDPVEYAVQRYHQRVQP